MRVSKVRTMVGVAMLGAISFIVMFFEFPIILAFPFLKIDFSDVIVLLGTFIYGPIGGIGVAVIRSLLHFIMTGASLPSLVGDFAGTVSSISMTIVMCLANWLFILPMYIKLLNFNLGMSMTKYVFIGLVPFNLIKGALVTVVFAVLYLRILPWLKQHMKTAV
ncbi:ECF transporter S component [Latilactobacillus sakei]|uniref:ECF transporter S component n=1 Tax=Latilactobacillus sakei TaxID=1599 RepID=UPI00097657B7|nr:ECF transporter S component [Latilactobacillus sakei]